MDIIKEFKEKTGLSLEVKEGNPYYCGSIDLRGTGITSLPDGLTVGGSIDLRGTGITSLPDGLTVGGSIDLRGTGITSLPDGLTVGGYLDLEGCTGITDTSKVNKELTFEQNKRINDTRNRPIIWEWNNKKYIKVDNMFTVIDSCKGNVYRVHSIGSDKVMYLVTDGNNNWAHGDTLHQAHRDMNAKAMEKRPLKDRIDMFRKQFSDPDKKIPARDLYDWHHTLTGSCEAGRNHFAREHGIDIDKDSFTVREFISLTCKSYGSDAILKLSAAYGGIFSDNVNK